MIRKSTDIKPISGFWREMFICLFIIVATYGVYQQVGSHGFVTFDDGLYVTDNEHVRSGLTAENISWSFSFQDKKDTYWHPLTWLSHMLDVELYGMDPGRHHLTNLFFHALNTLLLFLTLYRMTGASWRSATVAALFALHPINVESVAWIAERKNVLSTFFGLLALLVYAGYAKRPHLIRYLGLVIIFVLGLLTKPMLVTLPFVLLLLDYWPLKRIEFQPPIRDCLPLVFRLVLEKIPLLILSALSMYLSMASLAGVDPEITLHTRPLMLRIGNAIVSYLKYIGKLVWPTNLAVFYPYPDKIPLWQILGALAVLMVISVVVIRAFRKYPYLAVGWLWYLGTFMPVIGLMQAGLWPQMADRWAYVPFIGLFIMLAWGLPDIQKKWRYQKIGVVLGSALILPALMITTWLQVRHWSDNIEFYEHMIKVTHNNFMAHYNLGVYLADQDQISDAINHYRKALSIKPWHANANNNLANALVIEGKSGEAIPYYTNALNRVPDDPEIHNNLGVALLHTGKIEQAMVHFNTALKIRPNYIEARQNLQKAGNQ